MNTSHIPDELRLSIRRCFALLPTQGRNADSFLYHKLPQGIVSISAVHIPAHVSRVYVLYLEECSTTTGKYLQT